MEGYHKLARVERQVLYDQVWSQPMTKPPTGRFRGW